MADTLTSFRDPYPTEPPTVGEKLSDAAAQVADKAADLGRTAADKLNQNRDTAASGLDKAASALHATAENLPGGQRVGSLAHSAAEKLSTTADYVRKHDVDRMMADVETLVKNNPGRALLAAGVIGFLVGRAFTSKS